MSTSLFSQESIIQNLLGNLAATQHLATLKVSHYEYKEDSLNSSNSGKRIPLSMYYPCCFYLVIISALCSL